MKHRQPVLHRLVLRLGGKILVLQGRTGVPLERWILRRSLTLLRALAYRRELGSRRGLQTLLASMMNRKDASVALPDYRAAFSMRAGTTDFAVFEQIFIDGDYRPVLGIPDCKTIVDAGAYVGYSSVFFAHHFPGARVFAMEPDPTHMARLKEHAKPYPNIVPIEAALWGHDGRVTIANPDDDAWLLRVEESRSGTGAVQAMTMDGLMKQHRLQRLDIVKIDIEGGESEVFRYGFQRWMERTRVLIIELHDFIHPGSSSSFFDAIDGCDWRIEASGENLVCFREPDLG